MCEALMSEKIASLDPTSREHGGNSRSDLVCIRTELGLVQQFT